MIPKIIHYCWLSGDEFPHEIKRNIDSWKAILPDYEFMLWDTNRFDLEQWPFAKEAFAKKKYAFASDIVRLYAVQQYGGIYLDTDVQILKKFDDLLHLPYFVGLEYENIIEAAIFGAEKNAEWVTHCLKYYDNRSFVKDDGSFDITIAPSILKKQIQQIKQIVTMTTSEVRNVQSLIEDESKFYLFPCEFFSPKDVQTGTIHSSKKTYTIHHFNSSWLPYFSKLRRKIKLVLGVKTINKILKISFVSKTLKVFKKIEAKFDTK